MSPLSVERWAAESICYLDSLVSHFTLQKIGQAESMPIVIFYAPLEECPSWELQGKPQSQKEMVASDYWTGLAIPVVIANSEPTVPQTTYTFE